MNYDNVVKGLHDELDTEMQCAEIADKLMRKTWNPIKRISLWRERERFMQHCFGIELAISRIELEES